jgi:hypothetical protein
MLDFFNHLHYEIRGDISDSMLVHSLYGGYLSKVLQVGKLATEQSFGFRPVGFKKQQFHFRICHLPTMASRLLRLK